MGPSLDQITTLTMDDTQIDNEAPTSDSPYTRPVLPVELLSVIVRWALALVPPKSPKDPNDGLTTLTDSVAETVTDDGPAKKVAEEKNGEEDQLLFAAKRIRLASMHGMLMACRLLREVVLKEWFRSLKVSVNDWEYISKGFGFDILGSARYF